MTAVSSHLFRRWSRTDVFLVASAVVGVLLYIFVLPAEHPDAAASFALGEDEARAAADAFLAESGYALEGYVVEVALQREQTLLHGLQAELGRPATRRLLQDQAVDVPAYHWAVRYNAEETEDDVRVASYVVHVNATGHVWDFERDWPRVGGPPPERRQAIQAVNPSYRIDQNAFRAVVSRSVVTTGDAGPAPAIDFGVLSDSLVRTSFSFVREDSLWLRDSEALQPFNGNKVLAVLEQYAARPGGSFNAALEPAFAVSLAQYHLGRMAWDAGAFVPDSMWLLPERDTRLAHVRLMREEPLYGQKVRADAIVSAGGALLELDVEYESPQGEVSMGAEAGDEGFSFSGEGEVEDQILDIVADVAKWILYVVLSLVLIVMFFKRLAARLIDGKAVFLVLLVIGVLAGVSLGLIRELNFSNGVESIWLELLIRFLVASIWGSMVGLYAMMLSGITDSMAREVWSKKIHASSLVRIGAFRNIFVGTALMRGVGVAFVLLGLLAGFMALFPYASLQFEQSEFVSSMTWEPLVWLSARSGVYAYLVLLLLLLGVGTLVYRFKPQPGLVVGAIGLALVLVRGVPAEFEPVYYGWGISAVWGIVLGFTFWRYDFLTCFTGFFVALLVWELNEGWLVEGSPAELDVWLGGVFVLGLVVFGGRGILSGETRRAAAEYIPAYISELKQQERLRSEIDIARQVQASFLPRKMPDVPGLDIAAMCLAAHEVGGDYYDFIALGPGRLAVVVGDVSGKGTQAAFYMTLTKGIIQTLSREDLSPADVMRRFNTLFYENAPRGTFISMIYGVFDVEKRRFTFARAGHNPVILKRSPSQDSDLVQPTGLAIGLVSGPQFDNLIEERTVDLRIGDVLVFYTDGFSEAMNGVKDQYGDDRLARKVSAVGQRSATEILHAVAEDVHHFVEAAGRHDDMTMVVVKLDRTAAFASISSTRERGVAEA